MVMVGFIVTESFDPIVAGFNNVGNSIGKSVIKGGVGEEQSFFPGTTGGMGEKVIFPRGTKNFWKKPGHNLSSILQNIGHSVPDIAKQINYRMFALYIFALTLMVFHLHPPGRLCLQQEHSKIETENKINAAAAVQLLLIIRQGSNTPQVQYISVVLDPNNKHFNNTQLYSTEFLRKDPSN